MLIIILSLRNDHFIFFLIYLYRRGPLKVFLDYNFEDFCDWIIQRFLNFKLKNIIFTNKIANIIVLLRKDKHSI